MYPPIDFINIHAYTLILGQSAVGPDVETLVNIGKGHLDTMMEYMDHYGMSDLPIWITEFTYLDETCGPVYDPVTGLPDTNDIYFTECADLRASNGFQGGYLQAMIEYSIPQRRVQRFFPWALGEHHKMAVFGYHDMTSDMFYLDGTDQLNDQGLRYLSLAEQFDDSEPPVIATPSFETGEINITVSTKVTDPGEYSSGPVEYWYSVSESALTSIDTPADLLDWNFILTTSEQFIATIPLDMAGKVFNLIVRDSAGNESYKNSVIPVTDPDPPPDPDPEPEPSPIDINGDGKINIADYAILLTDYHEYRNYGGYNERSDLNADSMINIGDYGIFVRGYLENR